MVYDESGREAKKYLRYTISGNSGAYRADALTGQASFYNNPVTGVTAIPNAAFSETRFEPSH